MFEILPLLACEPMTLMGASLAISAASAASGYVAQKNQAKAVEGQQRRMGKLMMEESLLDQADMRQRQTQMQEATRREQMDIARRTDISKSTATLSALESGVGGAALAQLQGEYLQRESELLYQTEQQQDSASYQIDRDLERMRLSSKARMASNYRPINQPSAGAAALQFGGQALEAYGTYKAGGFGELPPKK